VIPEISRIVTFGGVMAGDAIGEILGITAAWATGRFAGKRPAGKGLAGKQLVKGSISSPQIK
jgi:hypothetical protein